MATSSTQELQQSGKVAEAPPWVAEVTVMWMLKPELTGILDLTEREVLRCYAVSFHLLFFVFSPSVSLLVFLSVCLFRLTGARLLLPLVGAHA
jgi:hypothetical protein